MAFRICRIAQARLAALNDARKGEGRKAFLPEGRPVSTEHLDVLSYNSIVLTVAVALAFQFTEKPLMKDFIGLNVHTVLFKPDLYKPVAKLLRDYHSLEWDLGDKPSNETTFPRTRNGVNWDDLYGKWKPMGYEINVTGQFEQFPPDKWNDIPKQAFAYGEAFASYFGPSGKHPYVSSFEIGNEPQKYTKEQYRLMFESMAKGLRKGDPKLLISTCAVAVGDADEWSKDINSLNGLEDLYDVLNVHSYAMAEGWPTWRRSYPEDSKINYIKQIQSVIDWRNENVSRSKKVWLTEFGWDSSTKKPSAGGDASKWIGNTDLEQARYIVRSFLIFSGMDIDRAYMYWFNDDDQPSLHASSGITRNFQPKPSFYAMSYLLKTLGDYRFSKAVVKRTEDLYVYEFRAARGTEKIYAVWMPTGINRTEEISIPRPAGQITKVEEMPLTSEAPKKVDFKTNRSGQIHLKASETPVFIYTKA